MNILENLEEEKKSETQLSENEHEDNLKKEAKQEEPFSETAWPTEQKGYEPAGNSQEKAASPVSPPSPPPNEYWVRNNPPVQAAAPNAYGQGYQPQPYQPQNPGLYTPYNPTLYNNNQPHVPGQPVYRQSQYQYSPNSGWQQPAPPMRRAESYQWNFEDYDKAADKGTKKKKNRGLVVFVVSLICVLSIGLIGVTAYGVYSYVNDRAPGIQEYVEDSSESSAVGAKFEITSKPQISESLPVGGKMAIPQVVKAVAPSVVGVFQYRDMYLEDTGSGSGIVMSSDGYVITNAHVVAGGTAFKVILADGTPKDAELIGADMLTDLAVLKVEGVDDLTPAVFGDSTQIEVGEQVIAIGNPAGLELAGSVTQGIISAVNREIPEVVSMPLIQTDAAINPGNSGGALVNDYGQVIGINSSKIVAPNFEGIGFAIPISEAKPIIEDIVKYGRVTGRVKLGITAREIDEVDARNAGLQMGIRIETIDPESDLVKKDVQRFDIITHIDGERMYTLYDLKRALEKHKPGDRITLSLSRQIGTTRSTSFDVSVTLIEDK